MLKKTLKITLIVLFVLVGVAFAAPFLFKGKVLEIVKNQINSRLNATVEFKDIDISFFRHFPKVAVGVKELQITGKNEFSGDTPISARNIDVALNLMSVIKGSDFKIYSISIEQPRIYARVTKDGKANWNITKPDTIAATSPSVTKPYQLNLESYSITNGYIRYEDASSHMSSEINNLNHSGKGDFTADLFTLSTATTADAVSFTYGTFPFLNKTNIRIDADLQVDNRAHSYHFKTDNIHLNELTLATEGFIQLVNDSIYKMDIKYSAPSTDFKNILSLIPVVYQKNFASIKTSGQALFNGFVKGTYSSNQIPAYSVHLDIKNGFFQYPDLPKPVKNINLTLNVENPDGVTDHTVVNIPHGHIEMDNDPFDFRLLVKNPVSDMFVDAAAKGKLDLSKVAQLIKLEYGTKLGGLLNADVSVNGNVSAIEKQQYDKFNAAGTVNLQNFLYASKAYPDGVKLNSLLASFNPHNVTLSELSGLYMKTHFSANGTIDNLLPYMFKNQPLTGLINVKADQVNLNDWMGTSTDTATKGGAAAPPFVVPANLNVTVNAGVDNVHYDKLDMHNLTGALVIKDETVALNNIKSNALDGTIKVSGTYSTRINRKKPSISLNYDVQNLDVQKTFNAFNTVQKLMPVGQFLAGKLSSQLTMKGVLGDNMMPDLNSLTGNGNLLLIQGFLGKFAPLEKLASTLNIKELETISVKDIKNYIEFANGKVLVKPFHVKLKDIDMEIGGMHGFDQSLDYVINMKVPRALMGEKGNAYVNNLVAQVNTKGIPLKVSDIINLKINMGGTIKNPILKTDLKQSASSLADDMKQQVTDFAKAKIDSTRTAVSTAIKDTLSSFKKQALQSAGNELKKQLLGKKDTTQTGGASDGKKKIEESAKGLLENINPFNKKKKQPDSTSHQ